MDQPKSKDLTIQNKSRLKSEYYNTSDDDIIRKINQRKKKQPQEQKLQDFYQVRGYAQADAIKQSIPPDFLGERYQFSQLEECVIFFDDAQKMYIFLFDFGVIVFWNYLIFDERDLVRKFSRFFKKPLKIEEKEKEILQVAHELETTSKIEQNTIYLTSAALDEKLAHSYSIAQSLKLGIYENKVYNTIQEAKKVPKEMAINGEINLSQKEVYKNIGNIIRLRSSVNLISGMLDLPDIFWDNERCEEIYNISREFFDIDDRINIINKRLNLLKELFDLLNSDLQNKQMNNIKWIVIALILIMIFIEVFWNILLKNILKIVI